MIQAVLDRGPDLFRAEYDAAGVHRDFALRVDLTYLAAAITYMGLHFHYPKRRRNDTEFARVLAAITNGPFAAMVDIDEAATLLRAAFFELDHSTPEVTDEVAVTYLVVAAYVLQHASRRSLADWAQRYRALARIARRRISIDEAVRHPPSEST